MNSLLVAWKPTLLVTVLVIGVLALMGRWGLVAVAGVGFLVLVIFLLTGNLAMAGLTMLLTAAIIVLNFTGHINYNANREICQDGYHWDGPWHVVWAAGKLEFRMHAWYCPPEQRFDPREWKRL
jgi:hypothetical protein